MSARERPNWGMLAAALGALLLILVLVWSGLWSPSPVQEPIGVADRAFVARNGDLNLVEVDCRGFPVSGAAACYVFPPGEALPQDLPAALRAWATDNRRYVVMPRDVNAEPQRHAPEPPPLALWQAGGFTGLSQTLPVRVFGGHWSNDELPDTERDYAVQVLVRTGPEGGAVPTEFREAAAWLAGQAFPGYLVLR